MKINLHLLADHIKEYQPRLSGRCSLDLVLKHICVMDKNAQCEEGAAYILRQGKEALLKKQDKYASLSFIIIYPGEAREYEELYKDFSEEWSFLILRTNQQMKTVYQRLISVMDLLNDWFEELTEAVLCQEELQIQMNYAARFLKNPVALFDMSMSLLAWSGSMPENIQDPVWRNVLNQGYNTLDTFPVEERRQVFDGVGEDKVVIAPPMEKQGIKHNMMATLYHNGLPFACMAMNELNQPFDGAEYSYMRIIKKLLEQSPVLLRNVVLAKDKGSRIFLRLLRGQSVDERQMSIFLREHGWKMDDSIVVYLFRYVQDDKMNENSYRSHIKSIRNAVPDLELFYYESSLVAVERNSSISYSQSRLRKIGTKLAIPIGVSMIYQGYGHLHEAFLQAQAAWKYTGGQAGCVRYEDIHSRYVLETLNSKNNLMHFCHPVLLKLRKDDEWDRELLKTLDLYLRKGKRVSATAEALHIHRNTMLNRLRIIDEILGIKVDELDDHEDQILYISCMILCREEQA